MKNVIFLLPLLAMLSCEAPDNPHRAGFNYRGCLECDYYSVGESFVIRGESYIVADRSMLDAAISNDEDVTKYCTSKITSMDNLLVNQVSFNQDIGDWDVSRAGNVSNIFYDAKLFNQDISGWCVSEIFTAPNGFSTHSALTLSNHPVWGTCP